MTQSKYSQEVRKLLSSPGDEENKEQPSTLPREEKEQVYDVWSIPGKKGKKGFIVIRADADDEEDIIDSEISDLDTEPLPTKPRPQPVTYTTIGVLFLAMLVPLFCIAVQLYFIANPYTVTATLYTRSQQLSVTGTLQLGRVISPFTLSQSSTVPTTGKGHQDAKQATGFITFYNGQSNQVFIPAGTTLTGSSGEQIVTDQDATIPPQSQTIPPTFGQATVSAHAIHTGSAGNIPVGDINESCCTIAIKAINTTSFSGGQDERDFQTVAKSDIDNTAAPLKATLDQSMQNTVNGQLKSGEVLTSQHCTLTTTADHQPGQEASSVKVTVSETCSGIAYNSQELTSKVSQLLTAQAKAKLGVGYSMLDTPQVEVREATTQKTTVFLSFTAQSAWIYAISPQQQQAIKKLIAGKTTEQATELLSRLPGIERVSLTTSGFADTSQIPKDISHIHLALFYGL